MVLILPQNKVNRSTLIDWLEIWQELARLVMSKEDESSHAFPISLLKLANADCALAELLVKEPLHTLEALRCFQNPGLRIVLQLSHLDM